MKSAILSLAILASLLATVLTHSQTTDETPNPLAEIQANLPRVIRVSAEFIEMPEATYTKLISKPRSSADDTDLRAACAKLVEAGEASVLETMCVTALPGQSATTASIAEYIYPTEYEPGEVPEEVNGIAPGPNSPWGTPPTPSVFDAKNTGSTFEVEASIDQNDSFIELRFTPTIIWHVDTVNWGADKPSGAAGPIEMPTFYVLSVRTGAVVTPGNPTLVATLSPKNDKGFTDFSRKVMVFIRADLLTVGK
ncbi:MAG: hypothetical protein ACJAVK_002623 [Akkermansiaceae bacterium]|jgi:hypothetical protein